MPTLRDPLRSSTRSTKQLALLAVLCPLALYMMIHPPLGPWRAPAEGTELSPRGSRGPALMNDEKVRQHLHVPPGFHVNLYATGPQGARMLLPLATGDLLLSNPAARSILVLGADRDHDGKADGVRPLMEGLNGPHGIDLHEGLLYVAESTAVFRVPLDVKSGQVQAEKKQYIVQKIPTGGHWTRSLRIGPDNKLYLSVGSSCNVCLEKDPRRAAILRFNLDGSGEELFATGLRNSVGLVFQPGTGKLYATDNGRDLLGDDFPPCELNLIEQGQFYGWPYANGDRVPDPDFGKQPQAAAKILATRPPVFSFRAHNAPLGLSFLAGARLPAGWHGRGEDMALVALHGSWNRSRKDGYKVVLLRFLPTGITAEDFLWGFLSDADQQVIGRPVDVAVGADGGIYISDDMTGSIYRVGI